jgi:hypothetical protein
MVDLGSNGKLDIYPIGDSITLGTGGGYRNVVFANLTADGYDVDMLGSLSDSMTGVPDKDHEGHGGCTAGVWNWTPMARLPLRPRAVDDRHE